MGNKKSSQKSVLEREKSHFEGEKLKWEFANLDDENVAKKLQELQPSLECSALLLNNNKLQKCPDLNRLSQFSTLSWLHIHCNSIGQLKNQNIPKSVTWLYASYNRLEDIPDFNQHRLEILWLSHNAIQSVASQCLSRSLTELDLSENKLMSVPSLSYLDNLMELDLSGNQIDTVKLSELPVESLKCLYLQKNRIVRVDSFVPLKKLQKLALHNNSIHILHGLPKSLTDISLADNPIQELREKCFPTPEVLEVIQKIPVVGMASLPEYALQQGQIDELKVPPPICIKMDYNAVVHFFNTGCSFTRICQVFKESLHLHVDIFDSKNDRCYCDTCHGSRGDEPVYERGRPAKLYALPIGWYRFGLVVPARAKQLDAFNKWHRAYHGTSVANFKKIIEVGDLVAPGVRVMGGETVSEQPGHFNDQRKPAGFNTKKVFVTPSIQYAGCEVYARVHKFTHGKSSFKVQVVLQVLIRPENYSVSRETVGARHTQIDPHFSNDTLEWSTDEHGSTIIYGLLVKISE